MKHENLRNIYNCEIKDNCGVLKYVKISAWKKAAKEVELRLKMYIQ